MGEGKKKETNHKNAAERKRNSDLFISGHLHGISAIVYSERRVRARDHFFFWGETAPVASIEFVEASFGFEGRVEFFQKSSNGSVLSADGFLQTKLFLDLHDEGPHRDADIGRNRFAFHFQEIDNLFPPEFASESLVISCPFCDHQVTFLKNV
jgi:hypothetical protein